MVRTEKSSKRFRPDPRQLVPAEVVASVVKAEVAVAAVTEPREVATEVAVVVAVVTVAAVVAIEAAVVVAMARDAVVVTAKEEDAVVADPELPSKMVSRVNRVSVARDSPVSASPVKTERRAAKAVVADVVMAKEVVVDVVAAPKEVKVRTEDPDVRIANRTTTSPEKRERPFAENQSLSRRKSKRSATLLMTTLQTSLLNPRVLPLVASRR